jgi:hypothetical protein
MLRARDQITNRHFLFYLAFAFSNELTRRARGSEGHSDGPQGADRPFNINYSRPELVVLMRAHATSPYSIPKGFLPVAPLLGWAGLSSFREIVCHQVDFSKQLFPR